MLSQFRLPQHAEQLGGWVAMQQTHAAVQAQTASVQALWDHKHRQSLADALAQLAVQLPLSVACDLGLHPQNGPPSSEGRVAEQASMVWGLVFC